jgi:hypothetical protein
MPTERLNRVVSVDFWRGIALATIFIDHVPGNILERYTQRNFGFSDAAEVFVFLAGVAAALAYSPHFRRGAFARQTLRIGQRAFTLYTMHIVVLIVCGAMVAYTSLATQDARINEMMQFDQIAKDPAAAIVGIATLAFQPSSQNVLPLYVVLLAMAPVLILLTRRDARLALAFSGTLYLATQLLHLALPSYPLPEAWYFNPLAWQFLFALGLVGGGMIAAGKPLPRNGALTAAAGLYLILSFVVIHGGYVGAYDLSPLPRFIWDQDKTNLSLPRLLHIGALIYVVSRFPVDAWIRERAPFRPLILMGRHSLPVFSLGIVLSLAAQMVRIIDGGGLAFDMLLISFGLALQIGLAWMLEWQKTGLSRGRASADTAAARAG